MMQVGDGTSEHVEPGIDPGGVVGGAVEQFGDVDGHVVVGRRQFALGQPFEGGQRGLDPRLGADDVAQHLFALFVGHVQGGQHFEVGAHRGQRGAQFVRGHRGEVARRRERILGPVLFGPDALQHALHGFGDLDGLAGAAHRHLRALVGVDRAGLLGKPFERPHRESRQQPSEYRRRADRRARRSG